ncbi:cytochrome P450 [Coprinopsis sp. MPI-PUGE-AT-0042]|nr:cytochrome P450 [Coprinopsis sp. MPI-PUGE-AT-0042]
MTTEGPGKFVSDLLRPISTARQEGNLPWLVLGSLVTIFATSTIVKALNAVWKVNHVPGYRRPFFPYSIIGMALPTSWVNPGYYFLWKWRHENYKRFKSELISFVGLLSGQAILFTSNLDVMKQVTGGARGDWHKPKSASVGILQWGMNLVAAEGGEEWRRHRRVMGPAFSNDLYQLVWKKTAETYRDMCAAEGWNDKKVVEVERIQKQTFQLALLVIGSCGFGFNFTWTDPPVSADGTMSLQRALEVLNSRQVLVLVPSWVKRLPFKYMSEYNQANEKVTEWMAIQAASRKELVRAAGNGGASGLQDDCFTLLVKANESENPKFKLTDQELIGNIFLLLFAGHETTAHSFAATLAQLAVHQDVQQDVLDQILSVVGWDREPEFEQYHSLNKVLSAFYEALRLFPAGHIMFREALTDTVLQLPNPIGEEGHTALPVKQGTMIIVDMVGVQYNDRYFDEPEKYKPSRWHDIPMDSEIFSAFSLGSRACIGRKFATAEAVSFLTLFLRDWKVEPLLKAGETVEQWKDRVIDAELFATLGIKAVPLRFVRRSRP